MILVMKRKAPVNQSGHNLRREGIKSLCISKQKHSGSFLGGGEVLQREAETLNWEKRAAREIWRVF